MLPVPTVSAACVPPDIPTSIDTTVSESMVTVTISSTCKSSIVAVSPSIVKTVASVTVIVVSSPVSVIFSEKPPGGVPGVALLSDGASPVGSAGAPLVSVVVSVVASVAAVASVVAVTSVAVVASVVAVASVVLVN